VAALLEAARDLHGLVGSNASGNAKRDEPHIYFADC
jgi:hypothetical protein